MSLYCGELMQFMNRVLAGAHAETTLIMYMSLRSLDRVDLRYNVSQLCRRVSVSTPALANWSTRACCYGNCLHAHSTRKCSFRMLYLNKYPFIKHSTHMMSF